MMRYGELTTVGSYFVPFLIRKRAVNRTQRAMGEELRGRSSSFNWNEDAATKLVSKRAKRIYTWAAFSTLYSVSTTKQPHRQPESKRIHM